MTLRTPGTATKPRSSTSLGTSLGTSPSTWLACGTVAGLAAFVATTSAAVLYLDNVHGPFADHGRLGALTGFTCGVAAGALVFASCWLVARRSLTAAIVLTGVVCVASWVLLPRTVDVSESWVPQPNPRWSCTGWSFDHYPPGVMDGSSHRYCVGLEKRISDG